MTITGAKVAILSGARIVALLRDDDPGIAFPGLWDLPGGGREGDEDAVAAVLRETREETGLTLDPARLIHRRDYGPAGRRVAFFGARWEGLSQADLRLGAEGQALVLMPVAKFLSRPDAIAALQARLWDWLRP